MTGTNRTIAHRLHFRLMLGYLLTAALVIAALIPAASAAATKRAPVIKGTWSGTFPERVHGTSVAVGADGVARIGVSVEGQGLSLGKAQSKKLEVELLGKEEEAPYEATRALRFDSQGDLWFARSGGGSEAIVRRDPSGTVTEFALPKGETVTALTIGLEGDVWFTRSGYGEKSEAQIGRMTPAGAVTQFPLEPGSDPASITVGPDGALWFSEEAAGKIGRITTSGEVTQFPLGPDVQPRQIVSGAEGALWFSENPLARLYGAVSDRIGRITPAGEVTQFPVPFGKGTTSLAADPRGVVWFATTEGEFSSIAPSGNVGPRGCVGSCGNPIESLALGPDGSLWFAAGHAACLECGGGSDLMLEAEGTSVGQIPAGALAPADPDGPPAVDPYANQTAHPLPPIARTGKPREVEGNYAEFTGYINSRGYPTTWLFRWGKTKKYGHKTFLPEFPFGAEEGAAQLGEEIINLCPGTTYHYEIVAIGPGGRALGGDRAFRTPRQKHTPGHCLTHRRRGH